MAVVVSGGLFTLLWVLFKSTGLRPAGDDYCWAVGAAYGPIDGLVYWWESFAGYAVHNGALTYLVGMPLFHLPLNLASAVPFVLAALAVALTSVSLIVFTHAWTARRRLLATLAVPTVMVLWWVYWWYPMTYGADGTNAWLAVSMVHNQNINGGYVIEVTVAIWLWFAAWLLVSRRGLGWAWLFALAGIWSALSGPALAVGCLMSLAGAGIWWLWFSQRRDRAVLKGIGIGAGFIVLFSLLAHLSPGTQARADRMGTSFDVSVTRIGEWFIHVFPASVELWLEAFVTPGAIVVLATAIVLGYSAGHVGLQLNLGTIRNLTFAAVGFGLMLAVASRITNFFIYVAPYHAVPARIAAFLALFWGGLGLGVVIARRSRFTTFVAGPMGLIALVVVLVSAAVSINLTVSIDEQKSRWEAGPAPVIGIVTDYLEWPGGQTCWQNLIQVRPDLPRRGQDHPPYEFRLQDRVPVLT